MTHHPVFEPEVPIPLRRTLRFGLDRVQCLSQSGISLCLAVQTFDPRLAQTTYSVYTESKSASQWNIPLTGTFPRYPNQYSAFDL